MPWLFDGIGTLNAVNINLVAFWRYLEPTR
jgi:hypothetical protein